MRNITKIIITLVFSFSWLFPSIAFAEESLTVATWNVAFIDRSIDDLDTDGFLSEVDFDILIVNEIKQNRDIDRLKSAMGRNSFDAAISSFDSGDRGLEVGIISRFPITEVVEFDRSLDRSGGIEEKKLERVDISGIADVGVGRGFLVAKIPQRKLFVIATHLKSSRGRSGDSDRSNAQKRELVAAAVSEEALRLREANPDYTVIFGGDINVGVSDSGKNGVDLSDDRTDGYDDTHSILELGLINGLTMRSLAKNVGGTFVGNDNISDFPGTGAIDVLYAVGPLADNFNDAKAVSDRFGSDHLAVFANIGDGNDGEVIIDDDDDGNNDLVTEVEITNALPNPVGDDAGRETVTITNESGNIIDISNWRLQDKANNIYVFPTDTTLITGDNQLTLQRNTMPLNNNGDEIILFDNEDNQVGSKFEYLSSDVGVGIEVR